MSANQEKSDSAYSEYLGGFQAAAADGEAYLRGAVALSLGALDYARSRMNADATPRSKNQLLALDQILAGKKESSAL